VLQNLRKKKHEAVQPDGADRRATCRCHGLGVAFRMKAITL
jgi:hypothetical protein